MKLRWIYYELRYWYLKLKYALGLADEYPLIRPYWLLRAMADKVQPVVFTYSVDGTDDYEEEQDE